MQGTRKTMLVSAVLVLACLGVGGKKHQEAEAVDKSERADVREACEAKARAQNMEILRWHPVREVSPDVFQANLTVQYRGQPYERACTYNAKNHNVDFSGDAPGDTPRSDIRGDHDERTRARSACEAKAKSDNMDIVNWHGLREESPDHWQGNITVRWKGQEYERVCHYRDGGQSVDIRER